MSPTPPSASDLITAATRIADDVLFPAAEEVDRADTIPASHLAALAEAGLFGLAGAAEHGGSDVDPATFRRIVATIGGACGATFFVWVQHHGVVRTLRSSSHPIAAEMLPELCAGATVAGTAFAHLRRPTPAIRATRTGTGWQLDGLAPWATSWGIAERMTIAAATDDGQVLWTLMPGRGDVPAVPGFTALPLQLPVLSATGTVAFRLEQVAVADDEVVLLEPLDRWQSTDRLRAALGQPATLGVAERATRLLTAAGDPAAVDAAAALSDSIGDAWIRDGSLLERAGVAAHAVRNGDASAIEDYIAEASAHRADCLQLAQQATTALLAGVGGRGMEVGHPAQRLAREAAFYVIQAQTGDGRAATLEAAVRNRGEGTPADASP